MWCELVTTNSNPDYIGRLYLQFLHRHGKVFQQLTCDRGTENGKACLIHKMLQPNIPEGHSDNVTLYSKSARNQRAEMANSLLRKWCTDVYLQIFHKLQQDGKFQAQDPIDMPCLYAVFHPLLKEDLRNHMRIYNQHVISKQDGALYTGKSPNYFLMLSPRLFPHIRMFSGIPISHLTPLQTHVVLSTGKTGYRFSTTVRQ